MRSIYVLAALAALALVLLPGVAIKGAAADVTDIEIEEIPDVSTEASAAAGGADGDAAARAERAITLDGMSADESKILADKADKFEFQAEVSRMMKLIIHSLYKNKDIFLREIISNASDALDKIRLLSLTDKSVLGDLEDLHIKIHVDKENKVLHITDTGIGMTREDLTKNLGTIAKSGTSEFLAKVAEGGDTGNLIGQFGVGFYSAFLVADTVVVTSKHNDDKQHIWTSDASSFSIVEDPREDEQLGRGTRISLYLKDEAAEFLEENTVRDLIKKYSEFINFDIYLYTSKTVEVDPAELEAEAEEAEAELEDDEADSEDDIVEEEDEEVDDEENVAVETTKTVWDWEIINANKPIWTRNSKDIEEEEYNNFYKAFSKDGKDPLGHIHFTAEGEVTFRSILYIPSAAPPGFYQDYGKGKGSIKMYVRRVFITDEFEDMMPKYLNFLRGVVDSDDLPLNVSRETLQQHKLLKVIRKKLVRKALEMFKKLDDETYAKFWAEFGTSIKLGLIEDYANRTRLAKLLRFESSHDAEKQTSLEDYIERMKKGQDKIFFIAAGSRQEAETSPFVERLLKRGYEVLYFTQPIDEYAIQNLPDFEEKKFQNVAKEGLELDGDSETAKARKEELDEQFAPLTKFLGEALKEDIEKAVVSDRLSESPCALVASQFGMSGNMERIMRAQAYSKGDEASNFYMSQKKTLEINPRHPLIKNLLERAALEENKEEGETVDSTLMNTAQVLLDTARLRSGYMLPDSVAFAERIERMLRANTGVDLDAKVEEEPELPVEEAESDEAEVEEDDEEEVDIEGDVEGETHDEL